MYRRLKSVFLLPAGVVGYTEEILDPTRLRVVY